MKIIKIAKEKPYWIIFFIVASIYFFSAMYGDILITYHHSLGLLDCISEGNFFGFYQHSLDNLYGGQIEAVYSIPIYIIFSIWNIPCWILSRFCGVDALSIGCLLWLKLIVVLPLVGCAFALNNIMGKLNIKNISFGLFYIMSSLLIVYPALGVVQYDSPSVFLTLVGICLYVGEEKISWKTILIFSLAVSLKAFALFTFIILTLLKEKRIFYIIRNIAGSLLITVISTLLFHNAAGYKECTSGFNGAMLDRLFASNVPGGLSQISFFFFVFFVVCIIAYFVKPETEKSFLAYAMWLNALFYWGFFTFVLAHPYWIILFAPFILVVVLQYEDMLSFNYLIELAMEVSIILLQGVIFYWVYWGDYTFSNLILKHVSPHNLLGIENLWSLANKFELTKYYPVLQTMFTVTALMLLIFNNPWKHIPLKWGAEQDQAQLRKNIIIIRLITMIGLFALEAAITFIL